MTSPKVTHLPPPPDGQKREGPACSSSPAPRAPDTEFDDYMDGLAAFQAWGSQEINIRTRAETAGDAQ